MDLKFSFKMKFLRLQKKYLKFIIFEVLVYYLFLGVFVHFV